MLLSRRLLDRQSVLAQSAHRIDRCGAEGGPEGSDDADGEHEDEDRGEGDRDHRFLVTGEERPDGANQRQ